MAIKIEKRGDEVVIIKDCCPKPCATVTDEGIGVLPKHGSSKHPNVLEWQEIELAKREYERLKST